MSQRRLEAYLDEVERHLSSLSEYERREWREEAGQHLQALADAEEELGLDRASAEKAAIRRFGASERVGGMLVEAYRRARGASTVRSFAVAASGLAWGLGGTMLALPFLARITFYEQRLGQMPSVGSALPAFAVMWLGLLIGGAVVGRRLGTRAYLSHGAFPYLALLLPSLWVSGTFSLPHAHLLDLLTAVGAGLILGALAARFADRTHLEASATTSRPPVGTGK